MMSGTAPLRAAKWTNPGRKPALAPITTCRFRRKTQDCATRGWIWQGESQRISATGPLNSGGTLQTITLGIYKYIGNNNQEWNAIMATAVVASIPAAVLLVLAQRYVAAGVTAGAVKD